MRTRVQYTADFRRVCELPRRVITKRESKKWARVLTKRLRRKGGSQKLRPEQGISLIEIARHDGAVLFLPVGCGKTLIAYLAMVILQAKRGIIISKKGLEPQTMADHRLFYQHWQRPQNPIRFVPREMITSRAHPKLLEEYEPDVIFLDESDAAANYDRSLAARIERYKKKHPKTIIICATGTPSRHSILGYWHHLVWSLGEGAPVPLTRDEAKTWARVLDNRTRDPLSRPHPGALGETRRDALEWFARRLRETPGVVIIDKDSCKQPIIIKTVQADPCPKIDEAFEKLVLRGRNPGGIVVSDGLSVWRLENQLGCGFYTEYDDPQPPKAWRIARRNLARFVRRRILQSRHSGAPMDTTSQVLARYPEHPIVLEWKAVRSSYKPKMRTIWLSDATIDSARKWLERQSEPSIIWCGSVDFAQRLSRKLNIPYFGAGGKSAGGLHLHEASKHFKHIILSWNSAMVGFNLQHWNNQLIIYPPQSAKWLEQLFGRTHRSGQKKPVVVTFMITSGIVLEMIASARDEAQHNKDSVSLTQKILRAIEKRGKYVNDNSYRWVTGEERIERQEMAA